MALQTTIREEVTVVHELPRVVWGAVLAGGVIVIAIELALGLLGAGIGLSLTNPARDPEHMKALGISAVIWWFSSSLVAIYIGSWVAGHFARNHGGFHGLLVWALKAVLMFAFLATSVGVISAGAFALTNPKSTADDIRIMTQSFADSNLSDEQKRQELANAATLNTQMNSEEAKVAAAKASKKAAQMSLLAFSILGLGAIVSSAGGVHGARDAEKEVAFF